MATEILSDNKNDIKSDNISEILSDNKNDNKNENVSDCDPREAVRRQFYKNRIKRDNIKLEIDDDTPQEERRKLILEYQKKHRDETVNAARGILQKHSSIPENEEYIDSEEYMDGEEYMEYMDREEYMNGEEYMDGEEYMEVDEYFSLYYSIPPESKIDRMMLSEWMLDVPQDFTENWVMVPCPRGNRVRLISRWGETRAYSRRGNLHGVFPSALPGGHPDSDIHHSAAVDCIWIKSRKLFYILDVLYWSQTPFTNCEAEFRFFWLKNKFQETPEFKESGTDTNKYPILIPQNFDCNSDLSLALTNLDELYPLDGLLFYHRKALYSFGCTPLVTWLKPFMLPEVLGISVPSPLDEKPENYISFEDYMQNIKTKKTQYTNKVVANSMEIEGDTDTNKYVV